jgi:hypothetical protein
MDYGKRWGAAKDAINALLGLGFGPNHEEAQAFFLDIDGDFGVPTSSDVEDFIDRAESMDPQNSHERTALEGVASVLYLYSVAAFQGVAS